MNARYHPAAALIGLVLALMGTTVWAAQPPNNVASDDNRNTAGGTNALFNLTTGSGNTAFGRVSPLLAVVNV